MFLPVIPTIFTTIFTTIFPTILPVVVTVLLAHIAALLTPHLVALVNLGRASLGAMPVAVAALGLTEEGAGDTAGGDEGEAVPRAARTVPAVGTTAPVPATIEEDFILKAFHHLDTGFDDNETGSKREPDINADINASLGCGGGQADQGGKGQGESAHVHLRMSGLQHTPEAPNVKLTINLKTFPTPWNPALVHRTGMSARPCPSPG